MTPEQTITAGAGIASAFLVEILNRATPGHKFTARQLQAAALTLAAVPVVGWGVYQGGVAAVDWNTIVPMVVGAWAVALSAHDVAKRGIAGKP